MKVKFKSISITDFKGTKALKTDFGAKSTQIFGANETGKTTFADAISYVLTGKNSLGESNFEILPIDTNGLSPKVELEIEIENGDSKKPVTLTREYYAKYNKQKRFTGEYATVCYINGIKTGVKDFDKWIAEHICSPEIFRLIHDIKYFTENISTNGKERPWEAQRRLLMSLVDTNADLDRARSDAKYEPLVAHLERYDNATQLSQAVKANLRDTENDIARLNTEINAFTQQSNVSDNKEDIEAIKAEIKTLELEKADLEDKLRMNAHEDKTIQELKDKRYELTQQYAKQQATVNALKEENTTQKAALSFREEAMSGLIEVIESIKKRIAALDEKIQESVICPICGRELSQEQIQKIVAELAAEKKSAERDMLERILTLEEFQKEMPVLKHNENEIFEKFRLAQDNLRLIDNKIAAVETQITAYESSKHEDKYDEPLREVNTRIAQLNCKLAEANKANEIAKYITLQIAEKKEQLKAILDKRAQFAQINDLCSDFIMDKCRSIQGNINSLFGAIHFSLFRMNKTNDEIRECCDIKYNGVLYRDLSYSTKFIVSLKISMAFQKFYNIQFPILVDNAESIDGIETENQSIMLIKQDECCPTCGKPVGRKQIDNMWYCGCCKKSFKKKMKISLL